jgi:hypothetical protein
MRRPSWAWLVCLSLSPHVLLFAQTPDNRQNLASCTKRIADLRLRHADPGGSERGCRR